MTVRLPMPGASGQYVDKYHGAVLKFWYNHNYQIMSDIWGTSLEAIVWDEGEQRLKYVVVDVFDGTPVRPESDYGEVDATEEVWEKVAASIFRFKYEGALERAKTAALQITKGAEVTVTRGRTNQGKTGKVFAMIQAPYNMGSRSSVETKLGIALDDTQVETVKNGRKYMSYSNAIWAWQRNCDLVTIPPINNEEVITSAVAMTQNALQDIKRR